MKLHEVLPEQQLDEASLKQYALAGLAGASLFGAMNQASKHTSTPVPVQQQAQVDPEQETKAMLAQQIATEYRINPDLAHHIVELAHKYEKDTFPTARDILAVAGIESSYNPNAVSQLKRDPARGLMQVRPGVWGLSPAELKTTEDQIRIGSDILHQYYKKLKSKEAALHAYNMGITNYKRGKTNPRYVTKFQRELSKLVSI